MANKKEVIIVAAVFCGLMVVSAVAAIWVAPLAAARAVFGLFLLLFLPGFALLEVLFPREQSASDVDALDALERTTLSIVLSLVSTPLLVYALYRLVGIPITAASICMETGVFLLLFLVIRVVQRMFLSRQQVPHQ